MKPFRSDYEIARWAETQNIAGYFSVLIGTGMNPRYDSAVIPVDCFGEIKCMITYRGN